jgi:hypothetical protein
MPIRNQATTWIDIYAIQQVQDASGAWERVFVWQTYTNVCWQWEKSDVNEDFKQQRRIRHAIILTDQLAIYNLFQEKLTIAVLQGIPFECVSREDAGNKGKVFYIELCELISGEKIPGPTIGGGATGGGSAPTTYIP